MLRGNPVSKTATGGDCGVGANNHCQKVAMTNLRAEFPYSIIEVLALNDDASVWYADPVSVAPGFIIVIGARIEFFKAAYHLNCAADPIKSPTWKSTAKLSVERIEISPRLVAHLSTLERYVRLLLRQFRFDFQVKHASSRLLLQVSIRNRTYDNCSLSKMQKIVWIPVPIFLIFLMPSASP